MRARILAFHIYPHPWPPSFDPADLNAYQPEDPEDFSFGLRVFAGAEGESGEDVFDIFVCSPRWLASALAESEVRSGRHHLLMRRYDWSALEAHVRAEFASLQAPTWTELAHLLGRIGMWEFEDHSPSPLDT